MKFLLFNNKSFEFLVIVYYTVPSPGQPKKKCTRPLP